MKDILSKLSSYNLFNYLLPGIIFVILANEFTNFSFIQQDIVIGLFLYYFIGLVISRFGSLLIEPILRYLSFLKFLSYKDYVVASKKDEKIELFLEVNNTYRTLSSLFILLPLLKLYEKIQGRFLVLQKWDSIILVLLLLVLFLFSYRKQTHYITKRIETND
ncbi:MAG: hypothetical protein FVQ84_18955 [Planctomycetes bacterium]|nr:hypothetical protein [Planctomycetota bacterium]